MKKSIINIAICSCQRVGMLENCLRSLSVMEKPVDAQVFFSVIDNDPEGSARELVETYSANMALRYFHEPTRGIPVARNRAIDEAHDFGADFLVFIDDDEWVEPDWLVNLYQYALNHGGNTVISGAVRPELPPGVPEHLSAIFEQKNRKSGTVLSSCATNNVLVPIFVTRELGLRFDESRPLAGGTDTLFFCEAVARGVKIVKCAEALVHELIPPGRITLKWLAKRKYRVGITLVERKRRDGHSRTALFLSSLVKVFAHSLLALIYLLLFQRLRSNKSILRASRAAGVVIGSFGMHVNSYEKIDGG